MGAPDYPSEDTEATENAFDTFEGPIAPSDPILKSLLDTMEAEGFSVGLTLIVQGAVVSGTPIFMPEYLERFGNQLKAAAEARAKRERDETTITNLRTTGEVLRDSYAQHADQFRIPVVADGDKESEARRNRAIEDMLGTPRDYIMLKDATIVLSSGQSVIVNLWRGRFELVGGWSLGSADV